MKPAICIEMVYPELSFADRIRKVAEYGFRLIEFWSWKDKDPQAMVTALSETGVGIANYSGQRLGDLLRTEQHPVVLRDFQDALRHQKHYRSPVLMLLAQELGAGGRVVRPAANEASLEEIATIAQGVRKLLALRSDDTRLVFEPLNTVLDHPGYAVSRLETARAIMEATGSADFGVLADLYHQAVGGDNLRTVIPEYAQTFGYVHVADVPGRGEPGSGNIDWAALLELCASSGYDGVVGFEFAPVVSSDRALEALARFWENVFGPPR